MTLLAIDPGNVQSAWVVYSPRLSRPLFQRIQSNEDVLHEISKSRDGDLAIEMIASYGMPVGREVFETCVWIGRFIEAWNHVKRAEPTLIYRREVKLHLCNSARAKDGNVRQALIDRFGPGKDLAIGRKATPGPLYGFKSDLWAALGVAVTWADREAS